MRRGRPAVARSIKATDGASRIAGHLRLRQGASVDDIVAATSKMRGRPITVRESEHLNGTDACGVWFAHEAEDRIFHASTPYASYRQQIVLHELSHMLLGHDKLPPVETQVPEFFSDLPIDRVRWRASFRDGIEADAERLAYTLAELVSSRQRSLSGFAEAFE